MRHILTTVFLIVLLFPALAFGETIEDLMTKDGLYYRNYYKIFIGVPFSGMVMGKEQGSIKNGKEDGPWFSYHDNGQLWWKRTYKDGERDGPYIFYHENGQLWKKGTYKDDVKIN